MDQEVTLLIGDEKLLCKRQNLQEASQYFYSMFNLDMVESKQKEIRLHDIDFNVMKVLINFAHSGKLYFSEDNCLDLLDMAVRFQFDKVTSDCCSYLKSSLNSKNCLCIWNQSDCLCLRELTSEAKKYAIIHLLEVTKESEFIHFPKHLLIELLSNDFLKCKKEINVFFSVLNWVQHNKCSPDDIVKLFSCVRYNMLTRDDWNSFCNHSVINSNQYIKSLLCKIYEDLKLNSISKNKEILTSDWDLKIGERTSKHSKEDFYCSLSKNGSSEVGFSDVPINYKSEPRIEPSTIISVTYCSDSESGYHEIIFSNLRIPDCDAVSSESISSCTIDILIKFKIESPNSKPLEGYKICTLENEIYLLGGEYGIGSCQWNKNMWKCNISTKTWSIVTSLPQPRRHFQVVVLDSCIYVIGGFGQYRKSLNSMDCYDSQEDLWKGTEKLTSLVRNSSDVISHQGHIYSFGTEIYTYFPESHIWSSSKLPFDNIVPIKSAFSYDSNIYLISRNHNCPVIVIYDSFTNARKMSEITLDPLCSFSCIIQDNIYSFSEGTVSVINLITGKTKEFMFSSNMNPYHFFTFPYYDTLTF